MLRFFVIIFWCLVCVCCSVYSYIGCHGYTCYHGSLVFCRVYISKSNFYSSLRRLWLYVFVKTTYPEFDLKSMFPTFTRGDRIIHPPPSYLSCSVNSSHYFMRSYFWVECTRRWTSNFDEGPNLNFVLVIPPSLSQTYPNPLNWLPPPSSNSWYFVPGVAEPSREVLEHCRYIQSLYGILLESCTTSITYFYCLYL